MAPPDCRSTSSAPLPQDTLHAASPRLQDQHHQHRPPEVPLGPGESPDEIRIRSVFVSYRSTGGMLADRNVDTATPTGAPAPLALPGNAILPRVPREAARRR